MRIIPLVMAATLVSGCADMAIRTAERNSTTLQIDATGKAPFEPKASDSLSNYANQAERLSQEYVMAARRTQTMQDSFAAFMLVGLGQAAIGAQGALTSEQAARYAVAGFSSGEIGKRAASKDAISAMYTGALKMNCIASAARLGNRAWGLEGDEIALELTRAAMRQVMIETRSKLARDLANYSELVKAFTASVIPVERDGNEIAALAIGPSQTNRQALNRETFIKLLNTCLDKGAIKAPSGKAPESQEGKKG